MDVVYVVAPLLLIAIVLAAVWLERWSVPVILVALGAGIVFGSDVLGLWHFDDMQLTNQVANLALVFILFQGGYSTRRVDFRAVALPAGGLATWGVVLTALGSFAVLYGVLGWNMQLALLLSVIISSTDAAAIFSILRRQALPRKLSSTIEIESAANDPMAVLLTVAAMEAITSQAGTSVLGTVALFAWKFTAAPVVGWLMARGALLLFNRIKPQDRGQYYVLSLGVMMLVYGVTEMINASGMLAVFITGFMMGNSAFVYKQGVTNFSSALSSIANICMFALLGLQVFPHQFSDIWWQGAVLFLVLTFIARPFAVWLGTLGMGINWREKIFISWAGLRGSVPIVLATYPAAAGLAIGQEVFNLVFFGVLLSIALQGSTLGPLARLLKLTTPQRPSPLFNLELVSMAESDYDLAVVDLPGPAGSVGPTIAELHLPEGAIIVLITRGKDILIPKGSTRLQGWDQVTVLAHARDLDMVMSALERSVFVEPDPDSALLAKL
ncbi:MAG: potassium/proton antiporter [Moraxellaceae bacterium]